jgi:hypothetical protein
MSGRATCSGGDGRSRAPGAGRRTTRSTTAWLATGLLISLITTTIGCGDGPRIVILSPLHGSFGTATSVDVAGILLGVNIEALADVQVNGISAMPLDENNMFSVTVPLDSGVVIQPIVAEAIGESGSVLRERITVMLGDSIADGDFSLEGIMLRIGSAGLDELEPLVSSLVPVDLADLVPPGSLVVDNFCYQDTIFGCIGRIDATISGSPPPSISGLSIDVDPFADFVGGDVTLHDLFFRANVVAVTGIPFSCTVDVSSSSALIIGDYGLDPLAADPEQVDVSQLGGVVVSFANFNDSTNCGGFLGFIVEFFIALFVSDLQNDLVRPGLESFLNTVDAEGNTPVASAIEGALDAIEIAGPIGAALGVELEAPLFDISEDIHGITLGSDARITSSLPDPQAVDLAASFHVDQPVPGFGPLTPGGSPYELAICISASAFNQLLKAEVESGLLISTLTEFDFGSGPQTITAGLLAALLPQFGLLDPAELLQFDIRPTMAPILTGEIGPSGELATVRVPHLLLDISPISDPTVALLGGVVDVTLGLDATFGGGELSFVLTAPAAEDINVTLLENPLFVPAATLDVLLPALVGLTVPVLADSLGSFPLPDFLGLELTLVEVDRNGEFTSLFFDLSPAP